MSTLVKILAAIVSVYLLVALVMYMGQRRLMYFPDAKHVLPGHAGLANVSERILNAPDGARNIVWYGKAKPGQPTLLYFHGNGGGLAERADRIQRFMGQGWGVYMMAYRGYAGSTGYPTEANNIADARRAYDALVQEGVPASSIILYGESLGTNVATRMAAEKASSGLILESPYTSVLEIALTDYPFLPVRLLLSDRYETDKVIPQVRVPVLILHGKQDDVIPVAMAHRLVKLANEPKRLVILPEGEHSDLYLEGNNALPVVRDWIRGLGRRTSGAKE
jgi:Hydrolases of the alpha/beta superfamily